MSPKTGTLAMGAKFSVANGCVKVAVGAGFVVVFTGDIITMPGLSKSPTTERIDSDAIGQITGLFYIVKWTFSASHFKNSALIFRNDEHFQLFE